MMDTLAHRKELCFWGWGCQEAGLSEAEMVPGSCDGGPTGCGVTRGRRQNWRNSPCRAAYCHRRRCPHAVLHPYDRITHGYGKSFADLIRLQQRSMPNPPDWVAFPAARMISTR